MQCSEHPGCLALGHTHGNCCPADNGMQLSCCNLPPPFSPPAPPAAPPMPPSPPPPCLASNTGSCGASDCDSVALDSAGCASAWDTVSGSATCGGHFNYAYGTSTTTTYDNKSASCTAVAHAYSACASCGPAPTCTTSNVGACSASDCDVVSYDRAGCATAWSVTTSGATCEGHWQWAFQNVDATRGEAAASCNAIASAHTACAACGPAPPPASPPPPPSSPPSCSESAASFCGPSDCASVAADSSACAASWSTSTTQEGTNAACSEHFDYQLTSGYSSNRGNVTASCLELGQSFEECGACGNYFYGKESLCTAGLACTSTVWNTWIQNVWDNYPCGAHVQRAYDARGTTTADHDYTAITSYLDACAYVAHHAGMIAACSGCGATPCESVARDPAACATAWGQSESGSTCKAHYDYAYGTSSLATYNDVSASCNAIAYTYTTCSACAPPAPPASPPSPPASPPACSLSNVDSGGCGPSDCDHISYDNAGCAAAWGTYSGGNTCSAHWSWAYKNIDATRDNITLSCLEAATYSGCEACGLAPSPSPPSPPASPPSPPRAPPSPPSPPSTPLGACSTSNLDNCRAADCDGVAKDSAACASNWDYCDPHFDWAMNNEAGGVINTACAIIASGHTQCDGCGPYPSPSSPPPPPLPPFAPGACSFHAVGNCGASDCDVVASDSSGCASAWGTTSGGATCEGHFQWAYTQSTTTKHDLAAACTAFAAANSPCAACGPSSG